MSGEGGSSYYPVQLGARLELPEGQGACSPQRALADNRYVWPEWFFPNEEHLSPYERNWRTRHAKEICGACDIRAQCLDQAIKHRLHGIWGGMDERERRAERRRRKKEGLL